MIGRLIAWSARNLLLLFFGLCDAQIPPSFAISCLISS